MLKSDQRVRQSPAAGRARAPVLSRRAALRVGAFGLTASTLRLLHEERWFPARLAHAAPGRLPARQFDLVPYTAPVQTIDGVALRFPPAYTAFVTLQLTRAPTRSDQRALADALDTIEATYPFSPSGVFTVVSYGIPYFNRLPGGMAGPLVSTQLPRLLTDPRRPVLEPAVAGPTDVVAGAPRTQVKQRFNVPVTLEENDLLLTLRSDGLDVLNAVVGWLMGSNRLGGRRVPSPPFAGLFTITSTRLMFVQAGLPRSIADAHTLPYAARINPQSPMWMGFADQQASGSGPPALVCFEGEGPVRLTTARAGDYFAGGAIQHLSHLILDLAQFYRDPQEPYVERVQYMFRANPVPSEGYSDQFTDGGGPAYLENTYQGAGDAQKNAAGVETFSSERRIAHLSALQRSSRSTDGRPLHIRVDGPGFDALDVPDGSLQPKLHFSIFVPTAQFFATLRTTQASLDHARRYQVAAHRLGLERFLTATRRQNFLVPPRAHRAFPLLEFT
jgi:hypothetical protein